MNYHEIDEQNCSIPCVGDKVKMIETGRIGIIIKIFETKLFYSFNLGIRIIPRDTTVFDNTNGHSASFTFSRFEII